MHTESHWPRRILSGAAKLFTAATLVGATAAGAGAIAARRFTIRYETLPLLPAGHDPIRLLHIGDMHLVVGDRAKQRFVQSLAGTQPDLVVNIGDNPGGVNAVDDVVTALEPLLEFPGIFVAGSNDFYGPKPANPLRYLRAPSSVHDHALLDQVDSTRLFTALKSRGTWHQLGNTNMILRLQSGAELSVAGTHDAHLAADSWPGFTPDTTARPVLKLAVTHAPYRRVLDAAIADGAELLLAGHTHGGQVALPGYGAIVSNCDLPTGRAAGLFTWRSAGQAGKVNVTAGIGASPKVPLRTFCPPEAVVLDLVPVDTVPVKTPHTILRTTEIRGR